MNASVVNSINGIQKAQYSILGNMTSTLNIIMHYVMCIFARYKYRPILH